MTNPPTFGRSGHISMRSLLSAAGTALLLAVSAGPTAASATTFATAPALTQAQLEQLAQVTTWTVQVHKEFVMRGSASGGAYVTQLGTCGAPNYACEIAGWSTTVLETNTMDATFTVSGPAGCRGTFYSKGCPVSYQVPGHITETFSYVSTTDATATSGCPTATDGVNSNPGELTATASIKASGTVSLDGTAGHQASSSSEFFVDFSTNPPTTGSNVAVFGYLPTSSADSVVICGTSASSAHVGTRSASPTFYFANPTTQDAGGDTQVRIDNGQFVVSGSETYSDTGSAFVSQWFGCPGSSCVPTTYQEFDSWSARAASGLDVTPPVLTMPSSPLVVEATSSAGAVVNYTASANDPDDGQVAVNCNPATGSTFPLGTTTVSCTSTDPAGNVGTGAFTVQVVDTTPPDLTLPADNKLDATSPAGAQFLFDATAVDLVDGSVPVNCFPTSGTVFSIGTTIVKCSATDHSGNAASGSFNVTVEGAADQLVDLRNSVAQDSLGLGTSLTDQLQAALDALASGDKPTACADLQAFIDHVQAQSGKRISSEQASILVADATRIRAVIGC